VNSLAVRVNIIMLEGHDRTAGEQSGGRVCAQYGTTEVKGGGSIEKVAVR
jgi:hypothetical protein